MLIRDMTVSKKFAAWLDHAIFVVIPVFNVDGHENVSPVSSAQSERATVDRPSARMRSA
jgi:hypothetical protein